MISSCNVKLYSMKKGDVEARRCFVKKFFLKICKHLCQSLMWLLLETERATTFKLYRYQCIEITFSQQLLLTSTRKTRRHCVKFARR